MGINQLIIIFIFFNFFQFFPNFFSHFTVVITTYFLFSFPFFHFFYLVRGINHHLIPALFQFFHFFYFLFPCFNGSGYHHQILFFFYSNFIRLVVWDHHKILFFSIYFHAFWWCGFTTVHHKIFPSFSIQISMRLVALYHHKIPFFLHSIK